MQRVHRKTFQSTLASDSHLCLTYIKAGEHLPQGHPGEQIQRRELSVLRTWKIHLLLDYRTTCGDSFMVTAAFSIKKN